MAYTDTNFPTKKSLKDAIASGKRISVWSPGPFPVSQDGTVYLEGPHYPQPHRWYAQAIVADGIIVRVK